MILGILIRQLIPVAIIAVCGPAVGLAQDNDESEPLRAEREKNVARIAAIEQQAKPLGDQLSTVLADIDTHNAHKPDRRDKAAVGAFNSRSDELNSRKSQLAAELQALKNEEDTLLARNKAIDDQLTSDSDTDIARERNEFSRMNAAWLEKQQELIRQAVIQDKAWRDEVYSSIL
jgi:predicted  nucleic acid-binding Zn-ribbon protein